MTFKKKAIRLKTMYARKIWVKKKFINKDICVSVDKKKNKVFMSLLTKNLTRN